MFFDHKKKSICLLSATSILKILLPERQINKKIYNAFENLINKLILENWIELYILWELSLIKELGFEINLMNNSNSSNKRIIQINNKNFTIPIMLLEDTDKKDNNKIKEALIFNKNLLIENFINPNNLRYPLYRNILENYYK